jgi:hypothetical protein
LSVQYPIHHVAHFCQLIEEQLDDIVPDCLSPFEIAAALSNGVVLCRLVNKVYPGRIPHIFTDKPGGSCVSP